MTKRELIEHCLSFPGVYEDYPFDGHTAVMRVGESKKMFAFIDEMDGKLYINLKCDPIRADFLRDTFKAVTPGWHMNKKHWNTVFPNEDVPETELYDMITHSFELIREKGHKTR